MSVRRIVRLVSASRYSWFHGFGGGYTFTLLVFNDMHEFMNGDVRSFMSDDDE